MLPSVDIDRVARLVQDLSQELVLPQFRRLQPQAILRKDSPDNRDDVVTTVDHAMESALNRGLVEMLPSAAFVGEETAHAQPTTLDAISSDQSIWVVDPLDGTRNFVSGNEGFGIMVALVAGGATRAAWIHLPAQGRTFVAEEGAGAFLDGHRLVHRKGTEPPTGTVYANYMPSELRREILGRAEEKTRHVPGSMAAAIEYTSLATGKKDYVIYHRLHPWDHAAGALLVREAGGEVRLADGRPYAPRERVGPCLATASHSRWPELRDALIA